MRWEWRGVMFESLSNRTRIHLASEQQDKPPSREDISVALCWVFVGALKKQQPQQP